MKQRSLISSFQFASAGIAYVARTQPNFRLELFISLAVLLSGFVLRLSALEIAVLALTAALVLAAEALNTVVESVVDLVTTDYHPLAKVAKDVAAGSVLILAINSVIVGLLIFLPHLTRR